MVSFNTIPSNIRTRSVVSEVDNSRAVQSTPLKPFKVLVIGQKVAAGTATANTIVPVLSKDQAGQYAGRRSMLFGMASGWFENDQSTEVSLGVLDDNGAGVAASGTFAFTGTATEAGTIHAYVGEVYVPVGVAVGDTATTVGASAVAALIAKDGLPIGTPVNTTGSVAVPFAHKGEVGNGLYLSLNYQLGQKLPAGISCTVTQPTGGTTNPVLTTLIAAMGDVQFDVVIHPYTDATSLTAIEAEMLRRFAWNTQIDGLAITSAKGSVGTLNTLGNSRNSKHSIIVAQSGAVPLTPPWVHAARVGADLAFFGAIDPASPFQTLQCIGTLPVAVPYTDTERNTLLYNGIATCYQDAGGAVRIERLITTYKTNDAGGPDTSYLDANTLLTLSYIRYSWRARILQRYPRHKLASDGTKFGAGQPVMTPILMKSEALAWFRDLEELALVEGFDQFKRDLQSNRNLSDVNRLDNLLAPDLVNQLIVTATKFSFLL